MKSGAVILLAQSPLNLLLLAGPVAIRPKPKRLRAIQTITSVVSTSNPSDNS